MTLYEYRKWLYEQQEIMANILNNANLSNAHGPNIDYVKGCYDTIKGILKKSNSISP